MTGRVPFVRGPLLPGSRGRFEYGRRPPPNRRSRTGIRRWSETHGVRTRAIPQVLIRDPAVVGTGRQPVIPDGLPSEGAQSVRACVFEYSR
jgi:hypothetical protein